jgi:hypothetical protein
MPDEDDIEDDMVDIIAEIQYQQYQIYEADRIKFLKSSRIDKKNRKNFYLKTEDLKKRKKIIKKWEECSFLEKIEKVLSFIKDNKIIDKAKEIIISVSKMMKDLISSTLKTDECKKTIKPETLSKLVTLYDISNKMIA